MLNEKIINEFYSRLGIKVSFETINNVAMSDSNILRPVVDHAFEFIVAEIVNKKLKGKAI